MRTIFLFIFLFYNTAIDNCISFNADKINYKAIDKVALTIRNCNDNPIFYYIGLRAMSDTGWVYVISDIDNFNRNEVFVLKELSSHEKTESFYLKYIPKRFFFSAIQQFQLTIRYSNKRKVYDNSFLTKEIIIKVHQ